MNNRYKLLIESETFTAFESLNAKRTNFRVPANFNTSMSEMTSSLVDG